MYRGLILGTVIALSKKNRFAVWLGIILAAGLWSLGHYEQWAAEFAVQRLGFLVVDGCVLGWMAHRYRVGKGILFHMTSNIANYPVVFLICLLGV